MTDNEVLPAERSAGLAAPPEHEPSGLFGDLVPGRRGLRPTLALFLIVAAAYAAGAELSWQSFGAGPGNAFFPPAGVTVAALLLSRGSRWPAVLAGIVVSEAAIDLQHGLPVGLALGFALANCVEPVVGASCVRLMRPGGLDLAAPADVLRFVAGACVLGPVAGALIGASVHAFGLGGWWPGLALQWWAGDGVAVLVVGGPLLLWKRRQALVAARALELTVIVLLSAGLSVLSFVLTGPPSLVFLPVLVLAAFRLGDIGVVLTGTAFAFVANYMTQAGYGNFTSAASPGAQLALTQLDIAVVVGVGWLMALQIDGRLRATRERERERAARERAENQRAAAELVSALADASALGDIEPRVASAVRSRLSGAQISIAILRDDGVTFDRPAGDSLPARVADQISQLTVDSDAPGARAVREASPVYLSGRRPGTLVFSDARDAAEQLGVTSLAALPLMTGSAAIGYLGVWWTTEHEISVVEKEYLESVAQSTCRAIENIELRQAEQRERTRVEALSQLAWLLAAATTPQAIGEIMAREVRGPAGAADALTLGVLNADSARLEWIAMTGYPPEVVRRFPSVPLAARSPSADAVRTGRPVVLRTAQDYARQYPEGYSPMHAMRASSMLTWPLRVGTRSVGALGLTWRQPQRFDAGQMAFIATVAEITAQALVRAREFEDEHAIAAVLQRAVMPRLSSPIHGLDVGCCYRSAGAAGGIGGDWYDALALPAGGAYVSVGDVVGHGIAATEDMTQLRNAARALAVEGRQPAQMLASLDRLAASATNGQFATMAVAVFEPDAARMTFAHAGHPPILVRRARTGTVEALSQTGGPVLGAFEAAEYEQSVTVVEPGDIVFLYSDGLIERRGEDLSDGIARVGKMLAAWEQDGPLRPLCEQLIAGLASHPQADDMCVLAVRPTGAGIIRASLEMAG